MAAPDALPVSFRVMTQEDALEVSGWHYPSPYDFYDATADSGDLTELLDPELRAGDYLAAVDGGGAVVGFAQLVPTAARSTWGWACGPT
jgi:ribosomal-protein-alanine N-acetyltransferase